MLEKYLKVAKLAKETDNAPLARKMDAKIAAFALDE
jgi:hypothetical protein